MGVSAAEVLAGTSVTQTDLGDPEGDVSTADEITMARNVLRVAPDPASVGVAVGGRINLTNLGMFGFAAMASGTLRELISVGLRFFSLSTLHVSIELSEGPADCEVVLDASDLSDDVRRFFIERDIAAIVATVPSFVHPVLARHVDQIRVELALDEEYLRPLFDSVAIRHVEFDRDRTVIRFPRRDPRRAPAPGRSRTRWKSASRSASRSSSGASAGTDCRRECARNCCRRRGRFPASTPSPRRSTCMHPRTLRRRLAEEGTSFRTLTNDVRATLATELLTQVGLTVEQVARRLGYAETAAFNHAFSRWFGLAPNEYRRRRT